ncbi:hypothetical protein COC42_04165 [Sphingomonas spermidinifaciens]|uniref:Antitoxin Xre/MbcA/ParS-like toxin-binding domain-containing protein n=1 Tax=Sphingomonas spermidinifaciens TaxID=1141889 RepID=A0A2A4B728_9SPHN|nr:antitoxin Xre/MbcA/ParS toxin-binding domain-containing protein [Sphingomonas spermidinifaciens]PCD03568.1 hypothetical protein COC42_04165 [Sphingomonas spermidinifaciens]
MTEEAKAPPRRSAFQPRRTMKRMEPTAAERQGRITLLAWNRLGGDRAIAFLNGHDEALGGRPLDLAVASEHGLEAVERAIEALVAPTSP